MIAAFNILKYMVNEYVIYVIIYLKIYAILYLLISTVLDVLQFVWDNVLVIYVKI